MLNSEEKRESNYCREAIRGLLSKTGCPSKLMDQQSTAVSFPIPFSCMSVLSNHLTLAMQAGSVQLAQSPAPVPFHWGYKQQLHRTARNNFLIVCDTETKVLPAQQMPRALTPATEASSPILFEKGGTNLGRENVLHAPHFSPPSFLSPARHFSNPWAETKGFLQRRIILKLKDQDHGGFCTPYVIHLQNALLWEQSRELGETRMVFPFICLTKWEEMLTLGNKDG